MFRCCHGCPYTLHVNKPYINTNQKYSSIATQVYTDNVAHFHTAYTKEKISLACMTKEYLQLPEMHLLKCDLEVQEILIISLV